jgi:hypothetical protein
MPGPWLALTQPKLIEQATDVVAVVVDAELALDDRGHA